MSFTKAGIIQNVTHATGLSKQKSTHAVECVLEIMKETLASGDALMWPPDVW